MTTNYERIKNKTIDEMAEFIDELSNSGEYTCMYCKFHTSNIEDEETIPEFKCYRDCVKGVKLWLLEECE